jgi:hypothetical protein
MMIDPQPKPSPQGSQLGPQSPRTPYRADGPIDPKGQGSGPDYFPGKPDNDPPKFRPSARRPRLTVGWLQAH